MRRKDREVSTEQFFRDVTGRAEVLFMALENGEYPLCMPFNFARVDNNFYIHSAKEGTKLNLLAKNPHVGFSMAIDVLIDKVKASTYYKSVCGQGLARLVTDRDEKRLALDAITVKYDAVCKKPAPDASIDRVAIIGIEIVSWTGKACLPAQ